MMPHYNSQGYPCPPTPHDPGAHYPFGPRVDSPPQWSYPSHAHPTERTGSYPPLPAPLTGDPAPQGESWHSEGHMRVEPEPATYRSWPVDAPSYPTIDPPSSHPAYASAASDPSHRGAASAPVSAHRSGEPSPWSQSQASPSTDPSPTSRYHPEPYAPATYDNSMYASPTYLQPQSQHYMAGGQGGGGAGVQLPSLAASLAALPPLPRHTFTRTLVGPLSANACRLVDEHRKPGIFFLFQDLSVRTEGAPKQLLCSSDLGQ
jgi:hypothetical protein